MTVWRRGRRSIRLKGYDYAQAGAYFVTICTQNRDCLFGDIVDGEMVLNDAGRMAQREWEQLPNRFPLVDLDVYVVMPNHLHGIVIIVNPDGVSPTPNPVGGNPCGCPQWCGRPE